MKTIITIQHAQSLHHGTNKIGSWTDWDLTDLGKTHSENIGRSLSKEIQGKDFIIYSSDLIRARKTVEPLAKYLGIDITYRQNLREINHGDAVGKDKLWARENTTNGWSYTNFDIPQFNGGETWREFWERVEEIVRDVENDDAANIILVSHGVTMSVFQSVWMGQGVKPFEYTGLAGGVSFFGIDDDGKKVIHRLNDASYMNLNLGGSL